MDFFNRCLLLLCCVVSLSPFHLHGQFVASQVKHAIENGADSAALVELLQKIRAGKDPARPGYENLVQGLLFNDARDYDKALPVLEKAHQLFTSARDMQGELYASQFISGIWTIKKEPAKARVYAKTCIRLGQKTEAPSSLGHCFLDYAIAERLNNEYDSAFFFIRQALNLFESNGLKGDKGYALMNLGTTHHFLGNLDSAMFYYYQAVNIFEAEEELVQLAKMYNNMSIIANHVGDHAKAKSLSRKSIAVRKILKDELGLSSNYSSLGNIYLALQQYDSAAMMFDKALVLHRKKGDKTGTLWNLNNLGSTAYYKGDYGKSLEFFQEALAMAIEVNDSIEMTRIYSNHGWSLLGLKRMAEAKTYFEKGMEMASKVKALEVKEFAYTGMSDYYLAVKDYENALKYYSLSRDVKDQTLNESRTQQFAEMQTKYETEHKEAEITRLGLEQAEAKLALARQRALIGSLIGGLLATLGLGWVLYYRRKKRLEAALAARELEYRKQLLDATVQAEENERQRIAKDMHDGLVQSLAVIKMGLQSVGRKMGLTPALESEFSDKIRMVDDAANEARSLSHQMMPRALVEVGLVIALEDMLQKTLGSVSIQYVFEHFGLEKERFKQNIEIGLYRICQELVNNIIKHSGATAVHIQLLKTKTHLVLHVEDDGNGFKLEDKQKQSGIGLSNIFSRASAVNGEVSFEEGEPKGTVANVRVPITV